MMPERSGFGLVLSSVAKGLAVGVAVVGAVAAEVDAGSAWTVGAFVVVAWFVAIGDDVEEAVAVGGGDGSVDAVADEVAIRLPTTPTTTAAHAAVSTCII